LIRIGNAQGYWGDQPDAALRLVEQAPDLDVLTLDYLAEVSMSILALQRQRDPAAGYARDFVEVVRSLAPRWAADLAAGSRPAPKVIANAGGLNPMGCARACLEVLREEGCRGMRVAVVHGDDVLERIREKPDEFQHLETGEPLNALRDRLVTANAYLGAAPVMEALRSGADLVVTGRVADPSLTVAPCAVHHDWTLDQHDRIAGATVAGHVIECGTQVTGGISTHWLDLPDLPHLGFPVVEVEADGSFVVTKAAGTGGSVDERTVKEQLLYEIGDPDKYLSPDVTASFASLSVEPVGPDRVRVSGAVGRPAPTTFKVSATYAAGFRAAGMLSIFGRDCVRKARRCGEIVLGRLREAVGEPADFRVECLGAGDVVPGVTDPPADLMEVVLRIAVADARREVVERFSRELMALVAAGPQGVTGYAEGRPRIHEVFGYWPCTIDRAEVKPVVELLEV
jgi:hypothetical protein